MKELGSSLPGNSSWVIFGRAEMSAAVHALLFILIQSTQSPFGGNASSWIATAYVAAQCYKLLGYAFRITLPSCVVVGPYNDVSCRQAGPIRAFN